MTKRTKLFLDTEFTGLHQKTSLISLGIVSECGKIFYAEFTNFDISQVVNDDWLKEFVFKQLRFIKLDKKSTYLDFNKDEIDVTTETYDNENVWLCHGNTKGIKKELEKFLSKFEQVEIWSDTLAYDWVLFCNIFGHAFNIPKNVYYIPLDINVLLHLQGDADVNREEFVSENMDLCGFKDCPKTVSNFGKHNALWDAFIIKCCYEILEKK